MLTAVCLIELLLIRWHSMPCAYVVWRNQFYLLMHDVQLWSINTCASICMYMCVYVQRTHTHTHTHTHTYIRIPHIQDVQRYQMSCQFFLLFVCRNKMVASHILRSVSRALVILALLIKPSHIIKLLYCNYHSIVCGATKVFSICVAMVMFTTKH